MQYEIVILEMLTRIKKLEEEIERLNRAVFPASAAGENADPTRTGETYTKTTDRMIDLCYRYAWRLAAGESAQEVADEINDETGMNRNSAIMYLYAVNGMVNGTIYKRAISAKAIERYFNLILTEYGPEGLRRAIDATYLHVQYRRACGHTVDSIEALCKEYEKKL